MSNVRRTLAIKVQTPGGDNPLRMQLVGDGPFFRGIPVTGLALVGQGGTAPYSFTIISGGDTHGGVNGLTLNTDGTFSGSGDSSGRFVFVAQVADSAGSVFTHSFSLTFLTQLFWSPPPPPKGEITVGYSYQFRVRDAFGTLLTSGFTYSGTLPTGLSLSAAGALTGSPTIPAGISYFMVHATDGTDTLDIPVALEIVEQVNGYYLEDRDPPDGWGGGAGSWLPAMVRFQDWSAHIVITGGVAPYSLTPSAIDPPPTGIDFVSYDRLTLGGRTSDAANANPILMSVLVTDALGAQNTIQRALFIIDAQQGRITPQRNGSDLAGGNGALFFNIEEGDGVTVEASNDGQTVTWKINASAIPSGYGIVTINGISAASDGNLQVEGIGVDSSGGLYVITTGMGSQAALQFKDEGSDLGTPGTVDAIDFVGAGVMATRVGNKVTATIPGGGSGTVTSVGLSLPSDIFSITGSPVTGSGTLTGTKQNQNANLVFAGPASGSAAQPTMRALTDADLPFGITPSKAFDPALSFYDYAECFSNTATGIEGWTTTSGGTSILNGEPGHPGILRTSGVSGILGIAGSLAYSLGAFAVHFRFGFRIGALSSGTNRYAIQVGFRDNVTGAANDALVMQYVDNVNSGAFTLVKTISGVSTTANGVTTVAANTWYDCVIDITAAGVATLTANGVTQCNLSTLSTAAMRKAILMSITSGATHVLDVDYVYIDGAR